MVININDLFDGDYEKKEVHENDKFKVIEGIRCISLNTYLNLKEKYTNKYTIICRICGEELKEISSHLRNKHKINSEKYKKMFKFTNEDCMSEETRKIYSNKFKGENNPAYNHGGRLSPFSKKFIKYENLDENKKEENINDLCKKLSETQKQNKNSSVFKEYWMKQGYTEKESIELVKNRQRTFTKEKCIEKSGQINGIIDWFERQAKWQNTLKSKPQEEINRINKAKISQIGNVSKISQKLFNCIYEKLNNDLKRDCFYSELNKEKIIINYTTNKIYQIDFNLRNICIEFNGTYFHADKRFYKDYDKILDSYAKDIWSKDLERITYLNENNYNCLVIWEEDFIENEEKIINECLVFIKENVHAN